MEPSSKSVAIIILNWNRKEDTAECLQSVYELNHEAFDVIVVDNGSTDDSVSYLKKKFPKARYIVNEENFGYAKGNNVGMGYALKEKYAFILVLNNDTVVHADLLKEMLDVMDMDKKTGLVGAAHYYYTDRNKIQFSGGIIDWFRGNVYDVTRHKQDEGKFPRYRHVDTLAGSCLMIRRETLERIGLFDERFFLNYEETDLCCRAKEAGYKIYVSMVAKLWHKVSLTTGASEFNNLTGYFIARNKILFLRENSPGKYLFLSVPYHIFHTFGKVLTCLKEGKHKNIFALLMGLKDGFAGKYYSGSMDKLGN